MKNKHSVRKGSAGSPQGQTGAWSTPPAGDELASTEPEAPPCRPAPWWVKVFVPLHLAAITIYALPNLPSSAISTNGTPKGGDWVLYMNQHHLKMFPPVMSYMMTTGFWQYWDMFAPDPVQTDQYLSATIVYKNGQVKDYQYPRMLDLSIPQKFWQERYRKFYERAHDYYHPETVAGPRPYVAQRVAQRIALINDDSPSNPPVEVKLYMHEWRVPEPGGSLVPDYKTTLYFDYIVEQDQLAKDKAGGE